MKRSSDSLVEKGGGLVIETSSKGWFQLVSEAYRHRRPFRLVDDAGIGVDPASQTLVEMGRMAGLTAREWAGALVALGVAAAGVALVFAAVVDPEPTSKLGLLVGGGIVCILGGGLSTVRILTGRIPPNVRIGPGGIEVSW